jgi:hypothetical protein
MPPPTNESMGTLKASGEPTTVIEAPMSRSQMLR